jgi:hypothetical protein
MRTLSVNYSKHDMLKNSNTQALNILKPNISALFSHSKGVT